MEERCRLCLSEDISEESIFDSRNDGFSLSSKIMICTSLLVTAEDQYSKNICSNCADMLDLFFDFRNNCFKTHISMYNALNESPEECHLMEQMNGDREEDESIYENDKMKYKTNYSDKLKDVIETDGNGCLIGNVTEVLSTALVDKVTSEEVVLEVKGAKGLSAERQFQVGCYLTEEGEQDGSQLMRRFKCINCKKVFSSLVELDGHWHLCQAKLETEEAGVPALKEFIVDEEDMAVEEEDDGAVYEEEEEAEDEIMNEEEEDEEEEEEGVVNKKNGRLKEYYCKTCGKVFKQNSLLTRHIQVKHIKVRPYSCSDCPRKFFDKYELKYHQRLHQDVEDFVCNVCGRRFARRSGLKAHMRSHTGEKPFECTSCDKSFAHLNSLYTHERVHTGERPYSCQYCPRTFAQYSTAKSHEEMHMGGLRPHQCAVCDRMFRSESELRCHFISHQGSADHRCSICDRGFKKQAELKKHTRRYHSENRPYGCKHCPKAYLTLRELKCHETLHTGETPFTCLFCSRKYRLKSTLRKHMDKHHRGHLPGATLHSVPSCSINLSIF